MATMKLHTKYFYGNEVSEEGQKYNRLDYATLAKAFNHVMCNNIFEKASLNDCYWELVSGCDYDEETEEPIEVFQWFIVDSQGAEILEECNEIVYYNEYLDLYVWGVTHWGTSWDYVLTDVPINVPYDDED